MSEKEAMSVCARQDPLLERYKEAHEEAMMTDLARNYRGVNTDPSLMKSGR